MTREEKIERIEQIKRIVFDIQVGSDFLSSRDHERLRALYAEQRQLEGEIDDESRSDSQG